MATIIQVASKLFAPAGLTVEDIAMLMGRRINAILVPLNSTRWETRSRPATERGNAWSARSCLISIAIALTARCTSSPPMRLSKALVQGPKATNWKSFDTVLRVNSTLRNCHRMKSLPTRMIWTLSRQTGKFKCLIHCQIRNTLVTLPGNTVIWWPCLETLDCMDGPTCFRSSYFMQSMPCRYWLNHRWYLCHLFSASRVHQPLMSWLQVDLLPYSTIASYGAF